MKEYLKDLDAILISSTSNIIYLIGDFGFSRDERECFILVTKNKKYIITDPRYSKAIKKKVIDYEIIEIGASNFIHSAKDFFIKNKINKIGIEENNLTASEYKSLINLCKIFPLDLSDLRLIKKDKEIKNIKLACKIGDLAFEYIIAKIKLGITEKEIAALLENFIRGKNAETSFKSIVAFGINSAIPHHLSNDTKLRNNQIILLDFGVKINNYCSDMTRTVFFGKAPEKLKKMHKTVLIAQQNAIRSIKINKKAKEIDKVARDYILDQNYPNVIHAVGHGIGIDVHETPAISPNSKDIIKNGMIFSVEPGIYLENYGGVRIEDLVLVSNGLTELISHSEREIIELND